MVPKKKCGKKKACLNSVKLLFSVKVFRTLFHSFIHSMSILENIFFPVVVRSPLAVAAVVDIINVSTMLISLSPLSLSLSLSLSTKKIIIEKKYRFLQDHQMEAVIKVSIIKFHLDLSCFSSPLPELFVFRYFIHFPLFFRIHFVSVKP